MAGMAGAIPLFQENNVIVFILQNLQHATRMIPSLLGKYNQRFRVS